MIAPVTADQALSGVPAAAGTRPHRASALRRAARARNATTGPTCRRRRRSRRCVWPAGSPRRPWHAGAAVIAPGVTTDEIDEVVHDFIVANDAYPSTLGYRGFPKSCCTSVNEVICHGIPDARPLADGDIVKIDVTAFKDGVHGDNCATYFCGEVDEASRLLSRADRAGDEPRHPRGPARPAGERDRPRDRVLRPQVRLRRDPRLHRPRRAHGLPLRPGDPALRRATGRHGCSRSA